MKLKLLTLFCLVLIVCLPFSEAQSTQSTPNLSPVIEVTLPEFYNRARIDISGTTQVGAEILLYVNDQLERRLASSSDGTFTFNSVPLNTAGNNYLRIDGNLGGSFNSKTFNVYVDLVPPQIQLTSAIPSVLSTTDLSVTGNISEMSNLTIWLNNNSILQQQADAFSQAMALSEGTNHLIITAADNSGNKDTEEHFIEVDTQPPELTEVKPLEEAAFYYEGRAVDDITGKTEPGAQVYMFVSTPFIAARAPTDLTADKVIQVSQYHVTAGSDGSFKFDDIDFEHPLPTLEGLTPQQVSPGELVTSTQLQTDEKTVKVYLVAVDKVGSLSTLQMYTIGLGSCFSGSFDFTISPLPAYQTPSLLSPSRLDSGTEIISFVLDLNYRGRAGANRINASSVTPDNYWEINYIVLEKACSRDLFLERDPSYQYACQVLPDRAQIQQEINLEKTNWYFRYNLGQTSQFTNFSTDFWKTLNANELKFPIKVTVNYNEKLPGKDAVTKTQTMCREVSYVVDIPIDPRKVLPDWLLAQGQRDINKTIENIDKIIEPLDKVINYLGLACLGGTALRFVLQVYRRFMETWSITACELEEAQSVLASEGKDVKKCFIPDKNRLETCYYTEDDSPVPDAAKGEAKQKNIICEETPGAESKTQKLVKGQPLIKLTESNNQDAFSGVANAWATEEKLYTLYRYICDRVFCHAAPAKWTQEKCVAEIRQVKYLERGCSPDASTSRPLTPIDNCYEEQKADLLKEYSSKEKIPKNRCYALGNELYVVGKEDADSTTLKRVDKNAVGSPTLKVKKKGDSYYTAVEITCQKACDKVSGKWQAECRDPLTQAKSSEWYHYGPTSDCWEKNQQDCYCKNSEEKAWSEERSKIKAWVAGLENGGECQKLEIVYGPPVELAPTETVYGPQLLPGQTESPGAWPWSYRQWQIYRSSNGLRGVYYPTERYYSDRDAPAAFGLDYLPDMIFGTKTTEINPFTQHIGAVQSLCLTGISARLKMLKSILTGLNNCLHQIKTTGQADAGVCKELFTQYVCNLVSQVFSLFQDKCTPASQSSKEKGPDETDSIIKFFKTGSAAITDSMDDMSSELSDEYGNANLNSFLEGGSKSLMKKVCLAAFGYDVGFDVNTFVDAAYSTPFQTSAAVFSIHGQKGQREYLGFDPTSLNALYEYRAAWTIMAGCDIESYSIDLAAVAEAERRQYGLDCSAVNNVEPGSGGCDNLRGSKEIVHPFFSGTTISQGAYIDQNRAETLSDTYRFDHIKITLSLDPDWDAEKCFPKENRDGEQGIFYFPIYDATAKDVAQCSVAATDGRFMCTAFGLDSLSRTWIEKVQCQDPATGDWKDCERVSFSAAPTNNVYDKIKVRADVFTSGNKECLKAYVQTAYAGKKPQEDTWFEIIGLGQPRTIPLEMELVSQIDEVLFGSSTASYSLQPVGALNLAVTQLPTSPIPAFEIYFATNESMGGQIAGTTPRFYQTKSTAPSSLGSWHGFVPGQNLQDPTNQFIFQVSNVNLNYNQIPNGSYYYTNKTTISYLAASQPNAEQSWSIFLELYHPDTNKQCAAGGATKVRLPAGLAFKPELIIPIKIKPTRLATSENISYNAGLTYLNSGQNQFGEAATEFQKVISLATGSHLELISYYFYVAARVEQGANQNNPQAYALDIRDKIVLFGNRQFMPAITTSPEYQMIVAYLNEILKKINGNTLNIQLSPTQQNCNDEDNCRSIDIAWEDINVLLDIKPGLFYDPATGSWQAAKFTTDMGQNEILALVKAIKGYKQIRFVGAEAWQYDSSQDLWTSTRNFPLTHEGLSWAIYSYVDATHPVIIEELGKIEPVPSTTNVVLLEIPRKWSTQRIVTSGQQSFQIVFKQDQHKVNGDYVYNTMPGFLNGTLSGLTLSGTWGDQITSKRSFSFEFADYDHNGIADYFIGEYTHPDTEQNLSWKGTAIS